jgi:hypothetical protein
MHQGNSDTPIRIITKIIKTRIIRIKIKTNNIESLKNTTNTENHKKKNNKLKDNQKLRKSQKCKNQLNNKK